MALPANSHGLPGSISGRQLPALSYSLDLGFQLLIPAKLLILRAPIRKHPVNTTGVSLVLATIFLARECPSGDVRRVLERLGAGFEGSGR